MFPNFIALIPCRLSRKTRLKTIASNRTIVSAPRYFGIGNPRFDHLVGACEYPGRHVRSYSVTGKRRARFLYKTLLARHRRDNPPRAPPATTPPRPPSSPSQRGRTGGTPPPAAGSNQGDGWHAHPHSSTSVPAPRAPPPAWSWRGVAGGLATPRMRPKKEFSMVDQ